MHHFLRYSTSKMPWPWKPVKGPWRSLKMSPFDRQPMTSYWCSIVTMVLSRVISEIFNVEKYRDLGIPVKSQSRSLKVVSFDRLGIVFYWCSIVTLSLIRSFWDIRLEMCHALENWVSVSSRSLKMSPFNRAHMSSYWRSIVNSSYSKNCTYA